MDHKLLIFRLFIVAMCSVPSTFELHEMLYGSRDKLGPFMWIMYINVGLEGLFTLRHGGGVFTASFPLFVKVGWVLITGLILFGLYKSISNYIKNRKAVLLHE